MIFGRLYCRHVTAGSAAAEGGAASLFLQHLLLLNFKWKSTFTLLPHKQCVCKICVTFWKFLTFS